jgi:hypothetical protein
MDCAKPQKRTNFENSFTYSKWGNAASYSILVVFSFLRFLNAVLVAYLRHLPCQRDVRNRKQMCEPGSLNHFSLFLLTAPNILYIPSPSFYLLVFCSSSVVMLSLQSVAGLKVTCSPRHTAAFTGLWEADNWSCLTDIPRSTASATYFKPGIAHSRYTLWFSF